jgi:hypothetical protein
MMFRNLTDSEQSNHLNQWSPAIQHFLFNATFIEQGKYGPKSQIWSPAINNFGFVLRNFIKYNAHTVQSAQFATLSKFQQRCVSLYTV